MKKSKIDPLYGHFLDGLALKQLHLDSLIQDASLLRVMNQKYAANSIFFAYLPKTASTFFVRLLMRITNYKECDYSWGYLHNEQNFDLSSLFKACKINSIGKSMMLATNANMWLCDLFAIKPILITRPIDDILVSLCDHFEYESFKWPNIYVSNDFFQWPVEKKIDYLIDYFVPWAINYIQSWVMAERVMKTSFLWLTYDDITKKPTESVKKVFAYLDLDMKPLKKEVSLFVKEEKTKKNRFNVGKVGRGKMCLSAEQRDRMVSKIKYFKDVDFSKIGLI